ncbi:arginine--tRNA ligase [bacterium BMS3Bbin14]|nr:arginine--tRNA ligase [bacterium BMS3Abin13]GBE52794.1 arginine--tRNA ligase [bacterium BMS3Bbin14]HDK43885.1 arginine--tRNA ligase [Desulfobacteraceae bacterium]HDL98660.1 arginine--tRNA ligase [Desulfobacteraceae bacterium]HDO31023.1 arginine--tRNA ligase [Desulfobacteraceae bacterium]
MIKSQLKELIDTCFQDGVRQGLWTAAAADSYTVEVPRHEGQGDFSTNMALVIAGKEKRRPREVAAQLTGLLTARQDFIDKVEVAGPGFVNFFLKDQVWRSVLSPVCEQDADFGLADIGNGIKVMVEFVSANPTGPLSIGHGRNAVLGDAIARLLEAVGYDVCREYYFNDAGRQMRVLGASTKARYLELLGLPSEFPEDGYQGDYIFDIARAIIDESGDSLKDADIMVFKDRAQTAIFADIEKTLQRIGISFDSYFNEHTLYDRGLIDEVVAELRGKGLVYEKDDATWFKTTDFGQEQDRVIIKKTGEPTYRLPDIAYHREKFRRGFAWMIDIFGADHIATVPDVLAGIRALGYDDSRVEVILHQFVTLTRDGKQVKMSTRKATFITVDELLDEVGPDALRFFFLMRKPDSQLEFDLELAIKESQENPVYYVQYAHARLCSIDRQAAAKKVQPMLPDQVPLERLQEPEEYRLLKTLADYPALVAGAAEGLAPHRIIFYLLDLAGLFHSYYNKHKVITDDPGLTAARLRLCRAMKIVFRNGLHLVGLNAPEKM